MIRLEEVGARIEALVPDLAGKLGHAGGFSQMVERNQLPQVTPAGFVLPGGIRGGQAHAATGLFVQDFREVVTVVVVVRVGGDPLAAKAIDRLAPIVRQVVEAIAGWGPEDATGVFVLERADLVGATGGANVFQIDFALDDQLRI